MTIKLSETSKMKGTAFTWSLQAIETCPGALDKSGALVAACQSCYATKGLYNMPNVKKPRQSNRDDWKRNDWETDMIQAIQARGRGHFRWFDSGDMYDIRLAAKIYTVMRACPDVKFWLPTRMHKFPKFRPILDKMQRLSNCVVRKSSDGIAGERIRGKNSSTIITTDAQAGNAHICPATVPGNTPNCKANNCTACWDKSVSVIAYKFH